jgi:phage tail-like protein
MKRFLALFESILMPIEWTVDNFDLFLDPGTAPSSFLPWLANWHDILFNPSWNEVQRRAFLKDAYQIYALRGTRWALSRVLEIYTGKKPEIIEYKETEKAHTFTVRLPVKAGQIDRKLVESLIDMNKPVHTTYALELQP